MNINKDYYVIAGYDLTGWETDKFDNWKWTDEGKEYFYNQTKGNIQLFDDPMNGNYLYLGYVLASGDNDDFETTKLKTGIANKMKKTVKDELLKLIKIGVIDAEAKRELDGYQVLVFEECA